MRMGRRIGRPFCCCSYGYLRCCARLDRAATRSCLHYGVRGCSGSRLCIPGGGKNSRTISESNQGTRSKKNGTLLCEHSNCKEFGADITILPHGARAISNKRQL